MAAKARANGFVGAGPKRNPRVYESIINATVELIAELGYKQLTIEGIASRAGVGKATVYRWWQSKGDLVGEALAGHLDITPVPDLGDTREELILGLGGTVRNYGRPVDGVQITALATDLSDDPALMDAFRRQFLKPRRAVISEVLQRGVARGELPVDIDDDMVQDVFAGAIFYRHLMSGLPLDDSVVVTLVDLILSGAVPRRNGKRK